MPCRVPIRNASPTCLNPKSCSRKSTQITINNTSLGKVARQPSTPHPHPKKNYLHPGTQIPTRLSLSLLSSSSSSIHNLCFPPKKNSNLAHTQRYPAISTKRRNEITNLPHRRLRPFCTHRPHRRSRRSRRSHYSRRHNLRRRQLSQPLLSSQYPRYYGY